MFEPNQRVKVNLSALTIKGVAFSQNVQEALGTIIKLIAAEPPTYLVEPLFSFKRVKRRSSGRTHPARVAFSQGGTRRPRTMLLGLLAMDVGSGKKRCAR